MSRDSLSPWERSDCIEDAATGGQLQLLNGNLEHGCSFAPYGPRGLPARNNCTNAWDTLPVLVATSVDNAVPRCRIGVPRLGYRYLVKRPVRLGNIPRGRHRESRDQSSWVSPTGAAIGRAGLDPMRPIPGSGTGPSSFLGRKHWKKPDNAFSIRHRRGLDKTTSVPSPKVAQNSKCSSGAGVVHLLM